MKSGTSWHWVWSLLVGGLSCGWPCIASGQQDPGEYQVTSVKSFTLPRMSLSELGNPAVTKDALKRAQRSGLKFTDLPSIGSGLAKTGENEFVGITDRGPNGTQEDGDANTHRSFPLPEFCPTIVRFKLEGTAIRITESIPLRDTRGRLITGLSNSKGEEALYASAAASKPLPPDPNGVDPEGIGCLPNGDFVLVEEYSPSVLVVSAKGQVLMRYTPTTKPLAGATYPVKPVLPAVFAQRRVNKGFESVAVSGDGKWVYAILQTPMGDVGDKRYKDSRIVRVIKLDLTQPLDGKVAAEYFLHTAPAPGAVPEAKPEKFTVSDAAWVGKDKLLVMLRGKAAPRIVLADFTEATNVLTDKRAAVLTFEEVGADLAALGVKPAKITEVFSTAQAQISTFKLEGLAIAGPDTLLLANDNDFGIGDNKNGEPSKAWLVKLNRPVTGN